MGCIINLKSGIYNQQAYTNKLEKGLFMKFIKNLGKLLLIVSLLNILSGSVIAQGKKGGLHKSSLQSNAITQEVSIDYSDSPSSYGLAWHTGMIPDEYNPNGFVEWLGANVSPDPAPPAENADTYDDGVSWTSAQVGQPFDLTFIAILGSPFGCSEKVNVEAWIDYNQNGVFDSNEKALDWFNTIYAQAAIDWCGLDPALFPTTVTQPVNVPADAVAGNTWMRVRLWWEDPTGGIGIEGNAPPTGEVLWGEVEDYPITITPADDPNLLLNPSFELDDNADNIPDNWIPGQLVAGDGRSADFAKEGTYSLKITGDATKQKQVKQNIAINGNAGDVLVFSGNNKTDGASASGSYIGAIVYLTYTDGTEDSQKILFDKNTHDWTKKAAAITAQKNYTSARVYVGYCNQTGTGYFDDFKLYKTTYLANTLLNPSFEIDDNADNIPDNWIPSQLVAGDGRSADFAKEGTYSLKIAGDATKQKQIRQTISISGNAGETLVLTGENKTNGTSGSGGYVGAVLYLTYADATQSSHPMLFNKDTHDWNKRSIAVVAQKNYTSARLYITYYNQTGTAYFDDFKLLR